MKHGAVNAAGSITIKIIGLKSLEAPVMVKLSLKAMIIAGALFKALAFVFISLLNLLYRPYGGAYLALLTSIYPGYDPVSGSIGILVGIVYSAHCRSAYRSSLWLAL